jgi:hypothetical protein
MTKEYCVWYQTGAGGYIVSWLIQVALDPSTLTKALAVFPLEINQDYSKWKKWEATPPTVAVLSNSFYPATADKINRDTMIRETLTKLSNGGQFFWDLVHCRIKYYLVNFVFQSGNITVQKFQQIKQSIEWQKLHSQDYLKQQSDLLFDLDKNIFVIAPDRYIELSALSKNLYVTTSNLAQILTKEFPHLKTFDLLSIWRNRWIQELEKIINRSLNKQQQEACALLIDRYNEVMPPMVRDFCYED